MRRCNYHPDFRLNVDGECDACTNQFQEDEEPRYLVDEAVSPLNEMPTKDEIVNQLACTIRDMVTREDDPFRIQEEHQYLANLLKGDVA